MDEDSIQDEELNLLYTSLHQSGTSKEFQQNFAVPYWKHGARCSRRTLLSTSLFFVIAVVLVFTTSRMPSSYTSDHITDSSTELDALSFVQSFFLSTQHLQCWAARQHKVIQGFIAPIGWIQSLAFGQLKFLLRARDRYGDNFCACGEVFLSSFENVSRALTMEQARTHYLGEHPLIRSHLPDVGRSRNVFLLSLSDEGAGGDGSHKAFRKAFVDYVMTDAERRIVRDELDQVLHRLFDKAWLDFASMTHEDFYNGKSHNDGLFFFVHAFLHYTMFGLDPFNQTMMDTLAAFYFGDAPLAYYLTPVGHLSFSTRNKIEAVIQIYLSSPAILAFRENSAEYGNMTKRELAALSATIMRMAGVTGALRMAQIVTGYIQTGTGNSVGVPVFNHTTVWQKLNLDDDEELTKYIMECIRLNAVVSTVHRVATEDFSANINGSTQVFPKGTPIAIPVGLASLDRAFWGADVLEFDMHRPGLVLNSLGFNSVGGVSAGRECPGKNLAMGMCKKLLRLLRQKDRPISSQ